MTTRLKRIRVNNQEFYIDFELNLIRNVLNPSEIFNISDLPKLSDSIIGVPFDKKSDRLAFEFAPADSVILHPVSTSFFDLDIQK